MLKSARAIWVITAAAFRADPFGATASLLVTLAENAAMPLLALGLKSLTDAAANRDPDAVMFGLAIMAGALLGRHVATLFGFVLRNSLRERTSLVVQRRLAALVAGIPGVEHFERPDLLKEIEHLREEPGRLAWVHQSAVVVLGLLMQIGLTLLLLARVDPLLLLLPVLGIPGIVLTARENANLRNLWDVIAEPRRLGRHLFQLATTAGTGKEVRIFGLADELMRRLRQVRADNDRLEDRVWLRLVLVTGVGWIIFALAFVAAIAFVVDRAIQGQATAGDVVLTITLAAQIHGQIAGLTGEASWMATTLKAAGRYVWLLDYAAGQARSDGQATLPTALRHGIDVEHVSFAYPGTERRVLGNVDLHLPAGTTVAIVGENGAGKTTLVKLLTGLYAPTSGRICVDGIDIRHVPIETWREQTSAGFQDFARFELLARENVGVGSLPDLEDTAAVERALARAEASTVLDSLPSGLETQLGSRFEGGAELSGGQWQKLALGRAMMRTAPLLLVLDEPTAALDAQTEHALFERYAGAARRVAGNGAITVLVSHRFSTVRMADLIVVLAGGQIVETGSHAQLVEAGGLYAELYELQAHAYR